MRRNAATKGNEFPTKTLSARWVGADLRAAGGSRADSAWHLAGRASSFSTGSDTVLSMVFKKDADAPPAGGLPAQRRRLARHPEDHQHPAGPEGASRMNGHDRAELDARLDDAFGTLPDTDELRDLRNEVRASLAARIEELESGGAGPTAAIAAAFAELGDIRSLAAEVSGTTATGPARGTAADPESSAGR